MAQNFEESYLKSLLSARSAAEVARLQNEYSRLKIAQTACKIQLREQNVPIHCYEALELESILEKSTDPRIKLRRIQHLNRLCATASANLRIEITDIKEQAAVSSVCAKSIAQAREIQQYRSEEDADWSKF